MYKLRKRWTTRDGSLVADGRPWAITQDILNEFGNVFPSDKGCAICILVRLEGGPAKEVFFETTGGHHETHPIDDKGWAHTTMYNPGSGYNAEHGRGPWSIQADGSPSEIVDNIGLPNGEHVSTWVVLNWVEGGVIDDGDDDAGPVPVEPPAGYVPHIKIMIDDVLVYEFGKT